MLALLALVGCAVDPPTPPPPPPPDILLVVLDTVRADHLSTYGYGRPTSQQLTALAASGVRFDDATAPATWTWPSHASLFTGAPPWVHGARMNPSGAPDSGGTWTFGRLDPSLPTLAERLGAAGYRVEAHSSNTLLDPALGLTRGFDPARSHGNDDGATVAAALAAMRAEDPRPLFLFVNLMSAHAPYMVAPGVPWSAPHAATLADPPTWAAPMLDDQDGGRGLDPTKTRDGARIDFLYQAGRHPIPAEGLSALSDLYDGDLVRLDAALQRLVGGWIETGRATDVIAVTSDHGELLGEHGMLQHCCVPYPELTGVPLVLAAPGRLPAGATIATPVQLQQLYPTLLELAEVAEAPPGSLVAVAKGQPGPTPIQARAWPPSGWARRGGRTATPWTLHREGSLAALIPDQGEPQLYDLSSDPGMTTDLRAARPADVARLVAAARAQVTDGPLVALELGAEDAEMLQLLGYVE